jgi:hypothetical protein
MVISSEYVCVCLYNVHHRFRQAKFGYGGLISSSSQFLILPYRPLKTSLAIKVIKNDSKIIILLPRSKLVKQSVYSKDRKKHDQQRNKQTNKVEERQNAVGADGLGIKSLCVHICAGKQFIG